MTDILQRKVVWGFGGFEFAEEQWGFRSEGEGNVECEIPSDDAAPASLVYEFSGLGWGCRGEKKRERVRFGYGCGGQRKVRQ